MASADGSAGRSWARAAETTAMPAAAAVPVRNRCRKVLILPCPRRTKRSPSGVAVPAALLSSYITFATVTPTDHLWNNSPAGEFEPCMKVWQFWHDRLIDWTVIGLPGLPWPGPMWHIWQSRGRCWFSMYSYTDPCGLWQLRQFSRTGSCSHRNGPRLSAWHL